MRTDAETYSGVLPSRVRRRRALMTIIRSLLASTVTVVAYFVLPLSSDLAADTAAELLIGLAVLAALLTWQIREIIRSPYPAVQAVGALAVSVPLFLSLFAITYYLMGDSEPSTFSETLTRLDSMYFTVTTFATVGFGDITAVSQGARAVATVQMVGGLVVVGLLARLVVHAVQEGRGRHDSSRAR